MTAQLAEQRQRPSSGEPPLRVLAIVTQALFMASLGLGVALGDGATFPSPDGTDDAIVVFFAEHSTAVRTTAVLQFAAAVPLALYTSTVVGRLRKLGARSPGVTIAHTGGVLAAGFLTLSALSQWVLARPATTSNTALTRAFHDLAFLTGGPAHVVFLGLLVAGIAVPGLLLGLLRRPTAIAGLVIAIFAELSTLALVDFGFAVLLPIARFPALIWLIVAAFTLPTGRPTVDRAETSPA